MSRIAPEQLTFDFEGKAQQPGVRVSAFGGAQILEFSQDRAQARRLLAEKERDRQLLEDAAQRVRFF